MKILKQKPPNYNELQRFFPLDLPDYVPLFPYGDIIYNPSGKEIPEDVIFHEEIHQKQQGDNPEKWWQRYMIDKDFRLAQELEAYAGQYNFIKKCYNNKAVKEALDELADNLSSPLYQLDISFEKAKTLIRKYAKSQ